MISPSLFSAAAAVFLATLLFLYRRHFDQVTNALYLSAQRRRILHHDFMLMMTQSHCGERLAHAPRMSDAAPHLLDPHIARREYRLFGLLRALGIPPNVSSSQVAPPLSLRATDSRAYVLQRHARARSLQLL